MFRRIWDEIRQGENLDLYFAVLAAVVLIVLDLIGLGNPDWLPALTIAILALLAISLIGNRHRLESIQQHLTSSPQSVFLESYPANFAERILEAKELWIVGINLGRTMPTYKNRFLNMMTKNGATLRFILVDPDSPANTLAADRLDDYYDEERHKSKIISTLDIISWLKANASNPEQVDVRVINYIPSFGCFGVDIETPKGILYLEHYGYRLSRGDRPRIILEPQDKLWFELFKEQLINLWENGRVWKSSSNTQP